MSRKIVKVLFTPINESETDLEEIKFEAKDIFEMESKSIFEYFELQKLTNSKEEIMSLKDEVISKRDNVLEIIKNINFDKSSPLSIREQISKHSNVLLKGLTLQSDIYNANADDELLLESFFDSENINKNWYLAVFECRY